MLPVTSAAATGFSRVDRRQGGTPSNTDLTIASPSSQGPPRRRGDATGADFRLPIVTAPTDLGATARVGFGALFCTALSAQPAQP
jgi:hypothetical protein